MAWTRKFCRTAPAIVQGMTFRFARTRGTLSARVDDGAFVSLFYDMKDVAHQFNPAACLCESPAVEFLGFFDK